MNWNWYEWDTQNEFNIWHESIKQELGLPRLSIDKDGTEIEPLVSSYTKALKSESKWIAMVEEIHSKGLQLTEIRPPAPSSIDIEI